MRGETLRSIFRIQRITPGRTRPDLAEEGRGDRESKGGIGIRAGGEKLLEGARAFGGDGEVKGGLAFRQAEVGVCTMQDQLLGHPVMAGGKGE